MKLLLISLTIIFSTCLGNNKTFAKNDSLQIIKEKNLSQDNLTIQNILPEQPSNYLKEIIPIITLLIGFFMGKIYENWEERKLHQFIEEEKQKQEKINKLFKE